MAEAKCNPRSPDEKGTVQPGPTNGEGIPSAAKRRTRLLFLNRCYYPDVEATGQLLGELCTDLAETYQVTVIAGQPNFVDGPRIRFLFGRERHGTVGVYRTRNLRFRKTSFSGRAGGLLSYVVLALGIGLCVPRPDMIVVETDPPVLGVLGSLLKWWHRCPLVFYLQDLFPEVGLAMGRLRPGVLTTFLWWTTQLGLGQADRVIVLGEDMRQRVLRRGIQARKLRIVPNWADAALVRPAGPANSFREKWGLDLPFLVMYSGNLGLSQSLEHILAAARELRDEAIQFVFVGEGAAKAGLIAEAEACGLANVRFLPYQPKESLSESLSAADLHLVPLRKGLAGYIVPSKLYGILAAGVPYVAAVEQDSEVAQVTREHQTGVVVEPDSPEHLVAALRWCLAHREELGKMGKRGRTLAEADFDRRISAAKFQRVLDEILGPDQLAWNLSISDEAAKRKRQLPALAPGESSP